MSRGRDSAAWNHTAAVLALLASVHRDHKKHAKPYTPAEFHPYNAGRTKRVKDTKLAFAMMKSLFVPQAQAQPGQEKPK